MWISNANAVQAAAHCVLLKHLNGLCMLWEACNCRGHSKFEHARHVAARVNVTVTANDRFCVFVAYEHMPVNIGGYKSSVKHLLVSHQKVVIVIDAFFSIQHIVNGVTLHTGRLEFFQAKFELCCIAKGPM